MGKCYILHFISFVASTLTFLSIEFAAQDNNILRIFGSEYYSVFINSRVVHLYLLLTRNRKSDRNILYLQCEQIIFFLET